MADYKLPLCWTGRTSQKFEDTDENGNPKLVEYVVKLEDCNPACHCANSPMQAHFCMEGHMTECHAGMSCEQAECSHYECEREVNDNEEEF